ncbi:LexA family transcriptional regulator [Psychrobacillus sp. INOP01]|uniref:LexA family protein n=1 Tax=Psychrobacillus sp. INOP01 TaxID=2829187 RepID=UPI001F3966CA|nr:S24 family peptidase [Psychrobacillus sp. INOP01]
MIRNVVFRLSDVAAGVPISVSIEFDNFLSIPKDWIVSETDTFTLTVTGDSMIGAGIDKGDTVIVNRQQSASNGWLHSTDFRK